MKYVLRLTQQNAGRGVAASTWFEQRNLSENAQTIYSFPNTRSQWVATVL